MGLFSRCNVPMTETDKLLQLEEFGLEDKTFIQHVVEVLFVLFF